ncbi:unnamed protein product [Periconia digitata]|uniref:Uncharacterized protein n=1 Tax=Periconia digitata TaxID=1303443 RepID=A0A9W4UUT8_9PLEO|nr:unnamed protein product [Periconia digitata]
MGGLPSLPDELLLEVLAYLKEDVSEVLAAHNSFYQRLVHDTADDITMFKSNMRSLSLTCHIYTERLPPFAHLIRTLIHRPDLLSAIKRVEIDLVEALRDSSWRFKSHERQAFQEDVQGFLNRNKTTFAPFGQHWISDPRTAKLAGLLLAILPEGKFVNMYRSFHYKDPTCWLSQTSWNEIFGNLFSTRPHCLVDIYGETKLGLLGFHEQLIPYLFPKLSSRDTKERSIYNWVPYIRALWIQKSTLALTKFKSQDTSLIRYLRRFTGGIRCIYYMTTPNIGYWEDVQNSNRDLPAHFDGLFEDKYESSAELIIDTSDIFGPVCTPTSASMAIWNGIRNRSSLHDHNLLRLTAPQQFLVSIKKSSGNWKLSTCRLPSCLTLLEIYDTTELCTDYLLDISRNRKSSYQSLEKIHLSLVNNKEHFIPHNTRDERKNLEMKKVYRAFHSPVNKKIRKTLERLGIKLTWQRGSLTKEIDCISWDVESKFQELPVPGYYL